MSFLSYASSSAFIEELSSMRFENVFNPYSDTCPSFDVIGAHMIRRRNLEAVLQAAITNGVDSVWVARDLGYRGGRRTGLALTDEIHLAQHAKLFAIPELTRATKGAAVSERTASVIWHALEVINRPVLLWNVFPLHPHEPENPLSNRPHTRLERLACQSLLFWLIETLRPSKVVAIGRDAYTALNETCIKVVTVRHPSYGGQSEFLAGLARCYNISFRNKPNSEQLILNV
jgi:hypothetical protein